MYSSRTSEFIDKRLGEANKSLSQDEKYSHRLRMLRKKNIKRASKYSLEGESADLTHFGKKIGDMSKYELKQAFVGSGDERDQEPFSYDSLIAQSKDFRAEARRQKMEAEAELDDLNSSFKFLMPTLELRDIHQDKLRNADLDGDDDLAAIARSFQAEKIIKAPAGDRSLTPAERTEQTRLSMVESQKQKDLARRDTEYDEDDILVEDEETYEERESVDGIVPHTPTAPNTLSASTLIDVMETVSASANPLETLSDYSQDSLIQLAKSTRSELLMEYFKLHLFDTEEKSLVLMRLVSLVFPLDFPRHCIVVPVLKILESIAVSESSGTLAHFVLLFEFLNAGPKFSPSLFHLGGRLYRENEATRKTIIDLISRYCSNFTAESLDGVINHLFPELRNFVVSTDPFAPLQLHHFKPVEVLSLEPAYHEDGHEWNGDHKEMREAKKMEQKLKQEKRLTAKEMRREAVATESFHAIAKRKQQQAMDVDRKRNIAKMNDAEANYQFIQTDNGKDPKKGKFGKKGKRSAAPKKTEKSDK